MEVLCPCTITVVSFCRCFAYVGKWLLDRLGVIPPLCSLMIAIFNSLTLTSHAIQPILLFLAGWFFPTAMSNSPLCFHDHCCCLMQLTSIPVPTERCSDDWSSLYFITKRKCSTRARPKAKTHCFNSKLGVLLPQKRILGWHSNCLGPKKTKAPLDMTVLIYSKPSSYANNSLSHIGEQDSCLASHASENKMALNHVTIPATHLFLMQ